MDTWMDGGIDGWLVGWMDGWMDGQVYYEALAHAVMEPEKFQYLPSAS